MKVVTIWHDFHKIMQLTSAPGIVSVQVNDATSLQSIILDNISFKRGNFDSISSSLKMLVQSSTSHKGTISSNSLLSASQISSLKGNPSRLCYFLSNSTQLAKKWSTTGRSVDNVANSKSCLWLQSNREWLSFKIVFLSRRWLCWKLLSSTSPWSSFVWLG